MKDQNSYNLNGLRAVFWGMLLALVADLGSAGSGALRARVSGEIVNYLGIGFAVLSLVSFLMIIIGLSSVGKYSAHFRRSRNYYLWNVLLVIIAAVLVVVATWFIDGNQNSSGTMLGTVGMIIAAVVLMLLAGWLDILKIKQMMNGCSEVARQNDERKYSARCTRAWVYFMIFAVLSVVQMVILAVVAILSLLNVADTTGGQINSVEDMAGGFEYFFYVAGGLGISLVLLFISYLLVMGKVNGTLMRYHRVEIPLNVFEEEEEELVLSAAAQEIQAPAASVPERKVPENKTPAPTKTETTLAEPAPKVPAQEVSAQDASAREASAREASAQEVSAMESSLPDAQPETSEVQKPAAPVKQSGGKHARPAGFLKQSPGKHSAARQVSPRKATPRAPLQEEDGGAPEPLETAPSPEEASPEMQRPEMPKRAREAETMTIEMPKEDMKEAPTLSEEGAESEDLQ